MRVLMLDEQAAAEVAYEEMLRAPAMSVGRYRLPVGATDPQRPHTEDEIYVVRYGRAILRTPGGDALAVPGAVLFVPAGEQHTFVEIEEPLDVLVLFAPAEGTLSGEPA